MWLAYSFVHSIEIPVNRVVFIFCVLIIGAVSLGQRYCGVFGQRPIDIGHAHLWIIPKTCSFESKT